MSFAQGVIAGDRVAAGWLDAYESSDTKRREKLAQEEIAKIGRTENMPEMAPNYAAVPAEGLVAPQPSMMRQPAPVPMGTGVSGAEGDYTSVPGMRTGLQASMAPSAQPPVGAGAARGFTPQQIDAARSAAMNMPMSQRTQQEADIYAKYGLTKDAVRARERSYEMGRQEKQDTRTERLDARAEEEYGLRIGETKRTLKENEANRNAISALGVKLAAGETIDLPAIYQVATDMGANPTVLTAFVGDSLGINKKIADEKVAKMEREVREAISSPDKLNAYIAKNVADPNPDDNILPELRPVKGGWGIFYGKDLLKGTQIYADTKEIPGFQALAQDMIEKAKGNPLGWTIQKLTIEKEAAAIAASKASSQASASTSGLNAIRGNLVNRQIKDLDDTAANTKEAKKLMEDFSALTEAEQNGPKGRALEKQYNMLVAKPGAQLRVSPEAKAPKAMDEVEKAQLEAYNKWLAEPRNARLPGGEKDAMAEQMGVSHLLRMVRERAAQSSGGVTLGGDAYAADRDAPAAPAPTKQGLTKTSSAPALNTGNTKLLGRAGNSGYSVEMPDGTTRVMSISELNKLGYQFLGGNTGLERPWYDDLLPRR
jgi:hypothetical protein